MDKSGKIFQLVDTMINVQASGQSWCAPLTDGNTIMHKLSGTSNSCIDFSSSSGISHSSSLSRQLKNVCVEQHKIQYAHLISEVVRNPHSVPNIIADNYNPSSENRYGTTKWDRVDTLMALLSVVFLPGEMSFNHVHPTLQQFNKDDFMEYWKTISFSNLIDQSFSLMDLKVNPILPKLYDHVAHPLIAGKSSSKLDIERLILTDLMRGELKCHTRHASLTVDPEPFNLIISLIHDKPHLITEELKFLIPMIGIFHLRKHFLEGSLIDHFSYLLLWQHVLPHAKQVKDQDAKTRKKRMIQDMLKQFNATAVRGFNSNDQKKIKMLKFHYLEEGKESDSFEATFFPNTGNHLKSTSFISFLIILMKIVPERGDDQQDELELLVQLFNLFLKIPDVKRRYGHVTASRKLFDFYTDPQVNIGMFHAVYDELKEMDLEDGTGLVEFLKSQRSEIELILQPLMNLFDSENPSASLFFSHLPKIITKISFDNHPNLLRGYLPFLQLLNKWRIEDPAIIHFISWNIHTLNDQNVENYNSIVKSRTPNNQHLTHKVLAREVACAGYRKNVEEELEIHGRGKNQLRTEFEGKFSKDQVPLLNLTLQALLDKYRVVDRRLEGLGPIFPDKFAIGSAKILHEVAGMKFGELYWKEELKEVMPEMEEYPESAMLGMWTTVLKKENDRLKELEELDGEMDELEEEKIDTSAPLFVRPISPKAGVLYLDFIVFLYQRGYIENKKGSFNEFLEEYDITATKKSGRRKKRRTRSDPPPGEEEIEPTRKKQRS